MKKRLVVLTGAGVSAESGISTFRDSDGLWENYKVEDVASIEGWYRNPELVLDFYNVRRAQLSQVRPNDAHRAIASLENEYDVTVILKNARTVVAKTGEMTYLNTSGNSGMASGGSGDVLAGILGGLIAQGMSDLEASRLGVYLHGKAGDLAAEKKGAYSMLARDIIDGIAEVTRE